MTAVTRNDKRLRIEDIRSRNRQQKIDRGCLVDEVTGELVESNNPQAFAEAADLMDGFRSLAKQMSLGIDGENNLVGMLDAVKKLATKLEATYDEDSDGDTLLMSGFDKMLEGWRDQAERYRERG